ncbi:MAG: hypothetical protein IJ230_08805 [Clostridia bacterium]|nr:hypothetical protein [Clostridia bacterium]
MAKNNKYEVDPELIRSLEDTGDFEEEYEYEYEDGPLPPKRVKWAWIILFLALGILIGALVFQLVGRNPQDNGELTHITETASVTETVTLPEESTDVLTEVATTTVVGEEEDMTKASIRRTSATYYVVPNTTKTASRITTRTAAQTTRSNGTTTKAAERPTTEAPKPSTEAPQPSTEKPTTEPTPTPTPTPDPTPSE